MSFYVVFPEPIVQIRFGCLVTLGDELLEVVFAVTHLLGFTFAPRLKKLSKHRLYSFEKRKVYANQSFQILPKAYINTKLIEENWNDILRFVATIKLKRTSASHLFKRLKRRQGR